VQGVEEKSHKDAVLNPKPLNQGQIPGEVR
jgi:hypothetical protein